MRAHVERNILKVLEGDCETAVGAHSRIKGDKIILEAEGFHPLAIEYDILVFRNNGQKEKINFLNFIRDGDLEQNPTFLEGDIIRIPFGDVSANLVALRGQVENSGYDIIEDKETLSQFLIDQLILIMNLI